MGLLDALKPPHAGAAVPDYVPGGGQPGKEHGGHLADRRIEQADRTRDASDAAEVLRHVPQPEPAQPVGLTRPVGNNEWEPAFYSVPVGQVIEIVNRDELRDTFDVTNQSAALLGKGCTVFLFRREPDAQKMANATATQRLQMLHGVIRAVTLPDGAGRTLQHTAPVFAVAVDTAATGATEALVDVSSERRSQPRP